MARKKRNNVVKPGTGTLSPITGPNRQFNQTQSSVAPRKPVGG